MPNPNALAQALRQSMPPAVQDQSVDPSWYRNNGSMKGPGFLGALRAPDGRTSTELSIGVNIGGQEMEIPSLVPTLTPAEIQHMLGGNAPTPQIVEKAVAHARQRQQQNLPVFK